MDSSRRQAIDPVFGQLGSLPAPIVFLCNTAAHTLLLSSELCQVALPKGIGSGALMFGLVSGLRKCVMIWTSIPKILSNSVASGRAPFTVHDAVEAPTAVGRQT